MLAELNTLEPEGRRKKVDRQLVRSIIGLKHRFTISSVKATIPPTYTVKDTHGEPVQGSFYEQELQLSVQEIFRFV